MNIGPSVHSTAHTDKVYQYVQCGNDFSQNNSFDSHISIYNEEKPYQCSVTRPSHRSVNLLYIQEHTLEKSHINAVNVARLSYKRVLLL